MPKKPRPYKLSHCCVLIEIGIILLFIASLYFFIKESSMKQLQNRQAVQDITSSWNKGFIFDIKRIQKEKDSTACPMNYDLVNYNFKEDFKFCFNHPANINFAELYKRINPDGSCQGEDVRCGVSDQKDLNICLPKPQHDMYGCPVTDFRISEHNPDPRYYTEVPYYTGPGQPQKPNPTPLPASSDKKVPEPAKPAPSPSTDHKTPPASSTAQPKPLTKADAKTAVHKASVPPTTPPPSNAKFWVTKTINREIVGVKSFQDAREALGYKIEAERPVPIQSRCHGRIGEFIQLSDEQSHMYRADDNAWIIARYIILALVFMIALALLSLCIKSGFFWSVRKAVVAIIMILGICLLLYYFMKLRNNHKKLESFAVEECFGPTQNQKLGHLSDTAEFYKFFGLLTLICLLIAFLIAILSHASLQRSRTLGMYDVFEENPYADPDFRESIKKELEDENYKKFQEEELHREKMQIERRKMELRQMALDQSRRELEQRQARSYRQEQAEMEIQSKMDYEMQERRERERRDRLRLQNEIAMKKKLGK